MKQHFSGGALLCCTASCLLLLLQLESTGAYVVDQGDASDGSTNGGGGLQAPFQIPIQTAAHAPAGGGCPFSGGAYLPPGARCPFSGASAGGSMAPPHHSTDSRTEHGGPGPNLNGPPEGYRGILNNKLFLWGTISVGTPPRDFTVVIDSTVNVQANGMLPASYLIDANTCSKGQRHYCEWANTYNATTSSTFANPQITNALVQYELKARNLSTAAPTYVEDVVTMSGVSERVKFMLLPGDSFARFNLIYTKAPHTSLPRLDGVISLAFTPARNPVRSGMEYLVANQRHKIATMYLEPLDVLNFYSKQPGSISIGHLNSEKCAADKFSWNRVNGSRWQIPLQKVETSSGLTIEGGPAIFSAYHTFIYGPKDTVAFLQSLVTHIQEPIVVQAVETEASNNEGRVPRDVAIRCPDRAKLPNITFWFGDQPYTLSPWQYVLDVIIDRNDPSKNICHLMIRPTPADGGLPDLEALVPKSGNSWFFGLLFFNQFCVSFDYTRANQRIGLAPHRHIAPSN